MELNQKMLEHLIQERGWTQAKLLRETQQYYPTLTQAMLSRWMHGVHEPKGEGVRALAKALGVHEVVLLKVNLLEVLVGFLSGLKRVKHLPPERLVETLALTGQEESTLRLLEDLDDEALLGLAEFVQSIKTRRLRAVSLTADESAVSNAASS
jgi:transcriptional regulator with XRE-family HTH domain